MTVSRWCALAAVLGLLLAGTVLALPVKAGCSSAGIEAARSEPSPDDAMQARIDQITRASAGGVACRGRSRFRAVSALTLAGGFEMGCLAVWLIAGRRPRLPSA